MQTSRIFMDITGMVCQKQQQIRMSSMNVISRSIQHGHERLINKDLEGHDKTM